MHKLCSAVKWGLALVLVFGVPVTLANVAPVENISSDDGQQVPDYRASAQEAPANTSQQAEAAFAPRDNLSSTEYNNNAMASVDQTPDGITSNARIERLEQQMSNLTQMNLPQQIEELRQEIQQLNGQLQVQQHDVQVLGNQQRGFYQDLNNRVKQLVSSDDGAAPSSIQKATASAATMPIHNASMKDSSAYRAAFNYLIKKDYPSATKRFRAYLDNYPNGAFVANAYYWLGEIYLKESDVKKAEKSFTMIVDSYPKSNKVSDAKLKLALIHINVGKVDVGRRELQAIKRQYPGSTAAQLASIQLQRME